MQTPTGLICVEKNGEQSIKRHHAKVGIMNNNALKSVAQPGIKPVLTSLALSITLTLSGTALAQAVEVTGDVIDVVDTASGSGTQSLYFDSQGLILQGDSTLDQPVMQLLDSASGGMVEINAAQSQVGIIGPGGETFLNTENSSISGNLGVTGQVSGAGLSSSDGLTVTGSSVLTGSLSVTGATTLNASGSNRLITDGTSARMVNGTNNMTVSATEVSSAFQRGGVSATIKMSNPGGGLPGGVAINAAGAGTSGAEASFTMTNTTTGSTHGLFVRSTETVLSGGTSSTALTLSDGGMVVTDSTNNDTFTVSNAAAARIGNAALAGSLAISNGSGANSVLLNGVANTITGTTSTTLRGGSTTLTLNNSGADLGGAQLHNVAAGTAPTDAVNVSQLRDWTGGLSERIDAVAERAYAGIASVSALAAIPTPAPGKRFTVGVGAGTYNGESAAAIGFRGALTESVGMTAGVSQNSASKTAANVGIGYSW